MNTPKPYVIDGKTYLHVKRAAEIIERVSEKTVWNWASTGQTSWGMKLDVVHERPPPDRVWRHTQPRQKPPDYRLLIAEESVAALREILGHHVRHNRRAFTKLDLVELATSTARYQRRLRASLSNPNP